MRCWVVIFHWLLVELVSCEASILGTHFLLQFPYMPEGKPLMLVYSLQPDEIAVTISAPRLPSFKSSELLVNQMTVESYAVPRSILFVNTSRGSALQAKSSALFGVTVYLPVSTTSGAAFQAVPVTRFGTVYNLPFTTVRPYICFLSATDLTSVELRADRHVPDIKAMLPSGQGNIRLQKGEARTIQNCHYVDGVISSIAVLRIKSNHPIGVITGNCEAMTKTQACQVIGRKVAERISGDMALPDKTAGKNFLIPMLYKHVCCVYFLSLSGKVTTLHIKTNPSVTSLYIPPGQYINLTAEQVLGKWINSSQPVVCYLEYTSTYRGVQERYGLSMIVPVELFTSFYVWSTITIKDQELHHFFAVVSPRDNFFLNVDGEVPKLQWTSVEGAWWKAATGQLGAGTHTAYAVTPVNFGLYVYGISNILIFPHYAGFVTANLYGTCQKTRPQLNDHVDNDCDGFVDEEHVNSKDDDEDGLIDEDIGQIPATFKNLKHLPATSKLEVVFPKSYPSDCPCPNPANCNVELCRGIANYIRCLEDIAAHPTCKAEYLVEARKKLETVSKVDISHVCIGKCPSSLHDCYPIKDMTSDMKSELSCYQLTNYLSCIDLFINNTACSTYFRKEATRSASEVTTLGQSKLCEGILKQSSNAEPKLRHAMDFTGGRNNSTAKHGVTTPGNPTAEPQTTVHRHVITTEDPQITTEDSYTMDTEPGGGISPNPGQFTTDEYDEYNNVDSCKEARTLCLNETVTMSCEKLQRHHRCALGFKDTPYCSEGVRKAAEEWIEKHSKEDCTAEDSTEICEVIPPSCQINETYNATICQLYQPMVQCEMNRLTKIWCNKEAWYADLTKAISNDEAAEKANCYGELPNHPTITLKFLQVHPADSTSFAFGLSTLFLTYAVDLNALDKEKGCYHLYFDYCKFSWTDCYKFEFWLTACVFPSDCHMLTCSKEETVVTHPTNIICNCINRANQMKVVLSIPTTTYDAIDYLFRLRVSSSKNPDDEEAVVEIGEIFKMVSLVDKNFAKLPFLSKSEGAKTELSLCGVLEISALVAFTLATTFN